MAALENVVGAWRECGYDDEGGQRQHIDIHGLSLETCSGHAVRVRGLTSAILSEDQHDVNKSVIWINQLKPLRPI